MFWTLYILVSVAGTAEQTFIGVESFESRVNCESRIDSKVIFMDDNYKFELKCLRTDESVNNDS